MKKLIIISIPENKTTNGQIKTEVYGGLDEYFKDGYYIDKIHPYATGFMVEMVKPSEEDSITIF
ncbi:hypothetical protein [Mucilaginibacter boryungensis]|uniref:Uncharacterized protein n=1 Tax=Mucilaginibacter boryungensis TaxID=768480 RepID=A0ABR9XD04_9SPHI|nr:hypothetical protein [Mucilaginibacter boryungensis]MBE9665070.1 hypothetical protein [Mucilaginibacter boryungensis]